MKKSKKQKTKNNISPLPLLIHELPKYLMSHANSFSELTYCI